MIALACLAAAASSAEEVSYNEESSIVLAEGMLGFIPKPEISICFCGSYRLERENGSEVCYLVNGGIDLSPYIDKRVRVIGRQYSAVCEGTLAGLCSYISVSDIWITSAVESYPSSWGVIKALYH